MASDATSFFDEAQQRAAHWLAAWDGQGIHRTATAGDNAGAEWLAEAAAALGAPGAIEVAIEEFALDRLDSVTASLEFAGERIAAVPAFDAPATDMAGVTGRLGLAGAQDHRAEIVRALVAAPPARPVVFTANSGHELGHLGLDDFLARRSGWDRPARDGGASWVHYGANIGAAGGTLPLVSPDDDLRDLAATELAGAGQPHEMAAKTLMPSGETRDIHRAGGRYLTLVGTNRWFHLPHDRWPHAVDPAAIARIAGAAARIVVAQTR